MAENEVYNKNASGGQSRLVPKSKYPWATPTGGDGEHAATAGAKFSSSWLDLPTEGYIDYSQFDPNKKAMSLEEQYPRFAFPAKSAPRELNSYDERTAAPIPLPVNPATLGATPEYRKMYLGQNAAPLDRRPSYIKKYDTDTMKMGSPRPGQAAYVNPAPAPPPMKAVWSQAPDSAQPSPLAQSPEPIRSMEVPAKEGFEGYVEAKQRKKMLENQVLPPPYIWNGQWKGETNSPPDQKLDPRLVERLARLDKTASGPHEDLSNPVDRYKGVQATPGMANMGPGETKEFPDMNSMSLDLTDFGPASDEAKAMPTGDVELGGHEKDAELLAGAATAAPGAIAQATSPDEVDRVAYFNRRMAENKGALAAHNTNQDALRAMIADLQGESQIDYRPLAAAVDTWTGSKMAGHFAGPRDRAPMIAQLQELIGKNDQHLSDSENNMLRAYDHNQTQLKADGLRSGGSPNESKMDLLKYRYKMEKEAKEGQNAFTTAENKRLAGYATTRYELADIAKKKKDAATVARSADKEDTDITEKLLEHRDVAAIKANMELRNELMRYRNLVSKYNKISPLGDFSALRSPLEADIAASYARYTGLTKNEMILGALTTSDIKIIQDTVNDPFGPLDWASSQLGVNRIGAILTQVDSIYNSLDRNSHMIMRRLRTVPGKNKNPRTHDALDAIQEDSNIAGGTSTGDAAEIRRLDRETRELDRATEEAGQ